MSSKLPSGMRRLSISGPGPRDVLCARGKMAFEHEGNKHFRSLVKQYQKQYSAASCKHEKSKVVSFIVSSVRKASPEGGFIKNIDGCWYEVGDRVAKEKVGQTFRDLLHTKYSSSTKAKARARMQVSPKDSKIEESTKVEEIRSNSVLFRDELKSSVSLVSDSSVDLYNEKKNNFLLPSLTSFEVSKNEGRPISPSDSQKTKSRSKFSEFFPGGLDYFTMPSIPTVITTTVTPPKAELEPLNLAAWGHPEYTFFPLDMEESFDVLESEFHPNRRVSV